MNFKKSALASAITLATFATGAAAFDASSWEVSGFVKNETAALQGSGTFIGQETTSIDTTSHNDSGDVIKFENTAKVFINGDVAENASLHAELSFVYDSEAEPSKYEDHMNYSQNDYLRELYVDTMVGDTEVRVGKQQVVWGTADGMKLLDIINPTDYREFAQNTMEDSRIPVWMLKTDTYVGDTGSLQFVISQAEENKIIGLGSASGTSTSHNISDQGNPYVMKGVDSITGQVNGFLNVSPALGKVAKFAFGGDSRTGTSVGVLENGFNGDGLTVYDYVNNNANAEFGPGTTWVGLCTAANTNGQNNSVTNLCDASGGDGNNPNNAFEYMTATSFATFDTLSQITTEYRLDAPDDFDANMGFRFRDVTSSGVNYSINYLYAYDPNPHVDMSWEDAAGRPLTVATTTAASAGNGALGAGSDVTTVRLVSPDGTYFNSVDDGGPANLVFTQRNARIHNVGASFDTTIDSESLPVVLRGEFLYQKDVMTPVIDRKKLGYGDLVGALQNQKADYFKYVIGADVNVLTNMMVSGQFIQFRNLDYVDEQQSCVDESQANCGKYTGDAPVLHLTNGLQKAKENKEFYSLFLSKPFGANQLGRWNNIFIFEEGGGKWNRFDVEYSFSDELVGSFELNNYWGDANTQFGQMEDSSNIQVGLKYLF
jgi:hypothetical protein